MCLMQNIDVRLLYKSQQVARFVSHLINYFSNFNFNCTIQLKQFYNIATKVSKQKKVLLLLVVYLTDICQTNYIAR